MAVQKSRKSRAKRDHRRAQTKKLSPCVFSDDVTTGELHRRHHITQSGYYRGEPVTKKAKALENDM